MFYERIYNFKNKNIFVGELFKGIGWESAKQFADFGGNITLVSRDTKDLKQRVSELSNNGDQTHNYITLDFSNLDELELELKKFVIKNSLYDIVVNNTEDRQVGDLEKATTEKLASAFNLHLISFHKIFHVLLDGLKIKKAVE